MGQLYGIIPSTGGPTGGTNHVTHILIVLTIMVPMYWYGVLIVTSTLPELTALVVLRAGLFGLMLLPA